MQRAVIYARFSSDMQREESIDAQVRACTEYCKRKGYVIVNVYVDEAKSGRDIVKRDAYNQMMADAIAHRFDIIIFHKIDRNARNEYNYYTFKNTLAQLGISYEYAAQDISSTPEGQMMETMLVGMAAYYSRNLALEVRKGLNENAYKALFNGGKPPLGYTIEDQRYVIEPRGAAAVRLIYDMYLDGKGYMEIIKALAAHGYTTSFGKPFKKTSLYEILSNEKYTGVYIYGRAVTGNNKRRNSHPTKNDNVIRVEDAIPAIISKEQFAAAQAKRAQNKKQSGSYKGKRGFLLSGKIQCALCGSSMCGHRLQTKPRKDGTRAPERIYYICSARHNGGRAACVADNMPAAKIEAAVLEALKGKLFSAAAIKELAKAMTAAWEQEEAEAKEAHSRLLAAKAAAERKLHNIYAMIEAGGEADEYVLERLNKIKLELKDIKERLDDLPSQTDYPASALSADEIANTISLFAQHVYKDGNEAAKRKLFDLFVDHVEVNPDYSTVFITTNIPAFSAPFYMVEMRGVEPLSENIEIQLSPSADAILSFASQPPNDGLPGC